MSTCAPLDVVARLLWFAQQSSPSHVQQLLLQRDAAGQAECSQEQAPLTNSTSHLSGVEHIQPSVLRQQLLELVHSKLAAVLTAPIQVRHPEERGVRFIWFNFCQRRMSQAVAHACMLHPGAGTWDHRQAGHAWRGGSAGCRSQRSAAAWQRAAGAQGSPRAALHASLSWSATSAAPGSAECSQRRGMAHARGPFRSCLHQRSETMHAAARCPHAQQQRRCGRHACQPPRQ